MEITWFPNSWIWITAGVKKEIYFDPAYLRTYFKGYKDKTEYSKWPGPIDGLPNGLEKADYIFITHSHKDHCKNVTVNRLKKQKTKSFAPVTCRKELGSSFRPVKPGDSFEIEKGVSVKTVNAYNTETGTSTRKQHKKGVGVGYILYIETFRIYHTGDTDLIADMKKLGKIDIAFLPIGGKFTMNIEEAVTAAKLIKPRIVIPVHHLKNDPRLFAEKIKKLSSVKCIIPEIGKPIYV